jgi:hypothetical protein
MPIAGSRFPGLVRQELASEVSQAQEQVREILDRLVAQDSRDPQVDVATRLFQQLARLSFELLRVAIGDGGNPSP